MAGFYSAIDLLCLPSLSESCSNVVAEALARGTPVVATRVGDNPVLVPDGSWLAEAGNPVDLARVLRLVLASGVGTDREVLRRGILHQLELSAMIQRTVAILRAAAEPAHLSRAS
jgi:glycosyltransferase involved in cell wall biosynthesis